MPSSDPFANFHPVVRGWFQESFGTPSPPQVQGWPSISEGKNTLILAPTGSGKTLAAFLWGINHLFEQQLADELPPGVRILYVSPLKALNNDIQRNLERPLKEIRERARTSHISLPLIRTAVRTGDTPRHARAAMVRNPPDILITTPESLYLILTSTQARKICRSVQYVIIDEIHSICGNKRGVHLSLSLERLEALADREFVRIGLSATQRPLETVAQFLGGHHWINGALEQRPVTIVDAGRRKQMDLMVTCAAPDFSSLPQESVWPLIFEELLRLIRTHRTTLVFVNNRRLAERVAAKLNEMIADPGEISAAGKNFNMYAVPTLTGAPPPTPPGDEVVLAYHGSMSRQARERMEADLKAGALRALIATSSLELGIDIGSIDLVVQLQSPRGVARGLQRVGRSGHLVTATSKGRILPTHREDLIESAIVARAMIEHDVEPTAVPLGCLDVLAQQIVAMVSVEDWDADELFDLIRQSYCYASLSRQLYSSVLHMLAGRYHQEAFRELRARISWDKVNNVLSALPGSGRLAITSGGTIADRGTYGVYLEDGKTKVGEVDEEFIYESRAGDTFILGTNVWKMLSIDANRVTVGPAPGQPARMPFWRGEGIGRSYPLSLRVSEFRKTLSERLDSPDALEWLQHQFPIDSDSAWNILAYARRQRDVTRELPHAELIVFEGFRDEIGDPRIVIHSGFGRRVNGLLGFVAARRLQEITGTECQMLYNDDGILLRCPEVDDPPLDLFDGLTVSTAHDIVLDEVLMSPLFGGQFRMNAARALLMPKLAPGKRTPLWLQRLRAGDLLQIARRYDDFPIVIETIREVLNDILDFDHFSDLVAKIESGAVRIRSVRTETPSPFAASLLFDFISVYMYEWDQPRADRLSQYLAINREVLSEVVDIDAMRSLLRPEAVTLVEGQLLHAADGSKARSPEELLEILIRVGDMNDEEVRMRSRDGDHSLLVPLTGNGRAQGVTIAGEQRWIAGEELALYAGLQDERALSVIIARYLQTHGPTTTGDLAHRYGVPHDTVALILERLSATIAISRGHFLPDQRQEQEWVYKPNLERIHRETISLLRREITPSPLYEYTLFLQHWQHLLGPRQQADLEGLEQSMDQLQALPLPVEIWERNILRQRIRSYSTDMLSNIALRGTFVWVGAGIGKMELIARGAGSLFLPAGVDSPELHEPAKRIHRYLRSHGASFFSDIRSGTHLSLSAMNSGIAELFWTGLVTNDVFQELLAVRRSTGTDGPIEPVTIIAPRQNPYRGRMMQNARRALRQVPGWNGRWSIVHTEGVMGEQALPEEQARRHADLLLERYGIVARELVKRESLLPWHAVATEFQRMELRGEIRRGYFVEGLSGMQYALPSAVEELRRVRNEGSSTTLLINACDPANPYGTGIELQSSDKTRISRIPGNFIAFVRGIPVLLVENFGSRLSIPGEPDENVLRDAIALLMQTMTLPQKPLKEIVVEYCDGERPAAGPVGPILRSLGFRQDRNQTMRYDGYP